MPAPHMQWVQSRTHLGHTASRHPDFGGPPGSVERETYSATDYWRTTRRLRRRDSSITSVTPAPSQMAPCSANSIVIPSYPVNGPAPGGENLRRELVPL